MSLDKVFIISICFVFVFILFLSCFFSVYFKFHSLNFGPYSCHIIQYINLILYYISVGSKVICGILIFGVAAWCHVFFSFAGDYIVNHLKLGINKVEAIGRLLVLTFKHKKRSINIRKSLQLFMKLNFVRCSFV